MELLVSPGRPQKEEWGWDHLKLTKSDKLLNFMLKFYDVLWIALEKAHSKST